MARRYDVKEIDLTIDDFRPFVNDKFEGFVIEWSSNIGFGEYTVYRYLDSEEWEWFADSETMDYQNNKEFITELMRLFIKDIKVM